MKRPRTSMAARASAAMIAAAFLATALASARTSIFTVVSPIGRRGGCTRTHEHDRNFWAMGNTITMRRQIAMRRSAAQIGRLRCNPARVAELADALDLGSHRLLAITSCYFSNCGYHNDL